MNAIFIPGLGQFEPRFTHRALEALYRETGTTPATFEPDSMKSMDALLYCSITADAKSQGVPLARANFQECINDMSGVEYMRMVRRAADAYREAFAGEAPGDGKKNA